MPLWLLPPSGVAPTGSDPGTALARDALELELNDAAPGYSTEAGLDHAITIENQRGGRLQHVELLCEIWAVGEVDVQVRDARMLGGEAAEVAMHGGAARAEVGAELQQGGLFAQRIGTHKICADDIMRHIAARATLQETEGNSEGDGDQEQHRYADQRIQKGHNRPA